MGRLDGKVAAITGGGSGMGKAAALMFGREGAKIVVADVNSTNGEAVVDEVNEAGGQAIFVRTDVRVAADCARMVAKAVETFGKLNILIANAGLEVRKTTSEMTEEEWDLQIDVNLKGVFLCCKYAIPELRKAHEGAIVVTASAASFGGHAQLPAYCASKAGVLMLTKSVAMEVARDNIRCNCIAPGPTQTAFFGSQNIDSLKERFRSVVPMGRMAHPDEMAKVMLFLVSDESSYVTGACLSVDGGMQAS